MLGVPGARAPVQMAFVHGDRRTPFRNGDPFLWLILSALAKEGATSLSGFLLPLGMYK